MKFLVAAQVVVLGSEGLRQTENEMQTAVLGLGFGVRIPENLGLDTGFAGVGQIVATSPHLSPSGGFLQEIAPHWLDFRF